MFFYITVHFVIAMNKTDHQVSHYVNIQYHRTYSTSVSQINHVTRTAQIIKLIIKSPIKLIYNIIAPTVRQSVRSFMYSSDNQLLSALLCWNWELTDVKMAVANMSTSCAECTTGKRDWSFWHLTALMFLTFSLSLCCLSYLLYLFAVQKWQRIRVETKGDVWVCKDVVESACV